MAMKTVVTMQDLSCYGKCSLTVALPVLSAAGVEAAVLPTALLSTHSGGLGNNTSHDLTDEADKILNHWQELGLHFDAVYTGYLASERQADTAIRLLKIAGEGAIKLTDPAMADKGRLYSSLPDNIPLAMARLCASADVITPNLSEAHILLGIPFKDDSSREYAAGLCAELCEKFEAGVVLSGVRAGSIGCVVMEKDGASAYAEAPEISGHFHGTGDLFASCLIAALVKGNTLQKAAQSAVSFVSMVCKLSAEQGRDPRHGLVFEPLLPILSQLLDG